MKIIEKSFHIDDFVIVNRIRLKYTSVNEKKIK